MKTSLHAQWRQTHTAAQTNVSGLCSFLRGSMKEDHMQGWLYLYLCLS